MFGVIMTDLAAEFDELLIDQAGLTAVDIVTLRKVSVTLFTFPGHPDDPSGGKEYNVQFNKIIDYKLELTSFSSVMCIVQAHTAFRDSEFLSACRSREKEFTRTVSWEKLYHFRIVLDKGQLDVIAEDFTCNLLWET